MKHTIPIGTYGHWPHKKTLSLTPAQAAAHWHVIGKTGSGKSTFLTNLFLNIVDAGMSATIIDPHGDLCQDILKQLVARGFYDRHDAYKKLLYLDLPGAASADFYLPFNILNQPYYKDDGIAKGLVQTMHNAWPELAQGAAMFDIIVETAIRILIANQLPITSIYRVINVRDYRERLLAKVTSPEVIDFWHEQFDRMAPKDQVDQAGAASRRAYQLMSTDVLKYSLGQDENVVDFRRFLDQGVSSIINLHVEGNGAQELLGSVIMSMAVQGALSRSQIDKHQRAGTHFLIVDEFEKFTSKSLVALSNMLSETRKYGLFLVVAHQDWAQAEGLIAALQNCQYDLAFQLGALDAKTSAMMLARVDPKSISEPGEEESRETIGMQEQLEVMRQELMELYPGELYLRKDVKQWPFHLDTHLRELGLYERPRTRLYKAKSPLPPRVQVDTAAIERRYIETLFRHKSVIEPVLAARRDVGRVSVVPPVRSRRIA